MGWCMRGVTLGWWCLRGVTLRGVYERGDIMGWCMRGVTLGGGV